ncbi:MAG: hypothetical protein MRY79_09485 [Alphaproteobacteria bacterium]|nr:hypothetical protein [Alphaproteobacteria bacterium]
MNKKTTDEKNLSPSWKIGVLYSVRVQRGLVPVPDVICKTAFNKAGEIVFLDIYSDKDAPKEVTVANENRVQSLSKIQSAIRYLDPRRKIY